MVMNREIPASTQPGEPAAPGSTGAGAFYSRRLVLTAGVAVAAVPLGLNTAAASTAAPARAVPPDAPFGPVTLYAPRADRPAPGTLYARAARLHHRHCPSRSHDDGRVGHPRTLLATFEEYVNTTPVFPIFRSTDDGHSWSQISAVQDLVNGWGLRYQPFLYELPRAFGGFPAGTVLCAGNSIPHDLSRTKIDLYASTDRGLSWRFLSSVARGGRAIPNNGETPVWEPFLLLHRNRLVCYYSDQRDPRYGQKLVHQVSHDLRTWGPVVEDFTSPVYTDRPGMTTVAALPGGRWIMTNEAGGGPVGSFFAVHYKIASDPESFGSVPATVLQPRTGGIPSSSPVVVWSPSGGRHGTIVVSAGSDQDLFINRLGGRADAWTREPSVMPAGYTRFLIPLKQGRIFTVSGGTIGTTGLNRVQDGIDQL